MLVQSLDSFTPRQALGGFATAVWASLTDVTLWALWARNLCGFEFPHEEVLLDSMTISFRRFVQSGLFVCWWLYNECFLHYSKHEWHSKFLSIMMMMMMLDGIYVLYIDIHAFWWHKACAFQHISWYKWKRKCIDYTCAGSLINVCTSLQHKALSQIASCIPFAICDCDSREYMYLLLIQ